MESRGVVGKVWWGRCGGEGMLGHGEGVEGNAWRGRHMGEYGDGVMDTLITSMPKSKSQLLYYENLSSNHNRHFQALGVRSGSITVLMHGLVRSL